MDVLVVVVYVISLRSPGIVWVLINTKPMADASL